MLVALCGLLRSYQLAWPVLSRQLRVAELGADVIALTSLAEGCTDADVARGRCPAEWAALGEADRRAELAATIGPRLRLVHSASIPPEDRRFGRSLEARAAEFVQARWRASRPGAPGAPTAEQLAEVARAFFDVYEIVVFTRPDVILVPPRVRAAERARGTLDLLRTCGALPGFLLVSGSLYRRFWYHARDWDFVHILCRPVTVADWLALPAGPNDTCAGYASCAAPTPAPPARPPGYSGAWSAPPSAGRKGNVCTSPAAALCDRAVYFEMRRLPMLALPDSLAFAHLLKLRRPRTPPPFGPAAVPPPARPNSSSREPAWPHEWAPCVHGYENADGLLCAGGRREQQCVEYWPAVLGPAHAGAQEGPREALGGDALRNGTSGASPASAAQVPLAAAGAEPEEVSGGLGWDGPSSAFPYVDRASYACGPPAEGRSVVVAGARRHPIARAPLRKRRRLRRTS